MLFNGFLLDAMLHLMPLLIELERKKEIDIDHIIQVLTWQQLSSGGHEGASQTAITDVRTLGFCFILRVTRHRGRNT